VVAIMDVDADAGAVGTADVPSSHTTTYPPLTYTPSHDIPVPLRRTLCLTPVGQPRGAATTPATCLRRPCMHRAADDSAGAASGPCACPPSCYLLLSVLRGARAPTCYDGVPQSLPPYIYRYRYGVGAVTAHSCPGRPHLLSAADN